MINIRAYYQPIQPTVKQWTNGVSYIEFMPDAQLQPYIYCYWELKTTQHLALPYNYRVVADGCIDIFFDMNKPQESFVMGFCKKFTEFTLEPEFHYVGIRFFPTLFTQVYNIDAATLSNLDQPLNPISSITAEFIAEHFPNTEAISSLLDQHFLKIINPGTFHIDKRMYDALDLILKAGGNINVDSDIDTGISSRQLRRLFEYYVGDTPKSFAKVVRFQRVLKSRSTIKNTKGNTIHFDEGFYDQGHFIKDFKKYYGLTPGKVR